MADSYVNILEHTYFILIINYARSSMQENTYFILIINYALSSMQENTNNKDYTA